MLKFTLPSLIAMLLLATASVRVSGDDKPMSAPDDEVTGVVAEDALARKAPAAGVLMTKTPWEALLKTWDVKKPFVVDFEKYLVVVATSQGTTVKLTTKVEKDGNLIAEVIGSADLQPGFRYVLKRIERSGIKKINGRELPKD
ncbi:hypothetical protein BH11PLA2_BH11PLA2_51930 [soil metagenome]